MITQNIIGFHFSALSDRSIYAVDAATLKDLPEAFSPATEEETNRAVVKAHQAWRVFRNTTGAQRADFSGAYSKGNRRPWSGFN